MSKFNFTAPSLLKEEVQRACDKTGIKEPDMCRILIRGGLDLLQNGKLTVRPLSERAAQLAETQPVKPATESGFDEA